MQIIVLCFEVYCELETLWTMSPMCGLKGDAMLDPTGTGTKILPFTRSDFTVGPSGEWEGPNINTHFIDASMVRYKHLCESPSSIAHDRRSTLA
jgi:hypothetical protein